MAAVVPPTLLLLGPQQQHQQRAGTFIALAAAVVTCSFLLRYAWTTTTSGDYDNGDAASDDANNLPRALMDAPDLDLRLIRKAEAVIQARSNVIIVVERCTNDHNYSAILRTAEALGIQHVWIIDADAIRVGILEEDENENDADAAEQEKNNATENDIENTDNQQLMPKSKENQTTDTATGKATTTTALSNATIRTNSNIHAKLTVEELEQKRKHKLFAKNATEWLDLREFSSTSDCIDALRALEYQIWATDLSQLAECLTVEDLQQSGHFPLPKKIALVFGTEAVGVSQEMLDGADLRVYLPLRGYADSLNLSVATALVIQQIFHLQPNLIGNSTPEEQLRLRKAWYPKLASQRLLGSSDKKKRKKLQAILESCDALQAKLDGASLSNDTSKHATPTSVLTKEQKEKLSKRPQFEASLREIEDNLSNAERTVAELIEAPPDPLTDLRRADEHRGCYVGKNTKQRHKEHWKGMAATAKTQTHVTTTSSWFRDRLRRVKDSCEKER